MKTANKRHWYDGWIYDRILAPNQKVPFDKISNLIPENSTVIDIGCGTGRLAFRLSGKCNSILAIDLSERNIRTALKTRELLKAENTEFLHSDISSVARKGGMHFDYAILSYILHEVNRKERLKILNDTALITDKIIISDHVSSTGLLPGLIREILEFGAGPDHYLNYRTFINDGGTDSLAEKCGFKTVHREIHAEHLQITLLTK